MVLKCHYCDTPRGQIPRCECSQVTEATIKAELAEHNMIWIPLRHSKSRTPLQTAKRDVLMKMVYTGQITIDIYVPDSEDITSEICTAFANIKPKI